MSVFLHLALLGYPMPMLFAPNEAGLEESCFREVARNAHAGARLRAMLMPMSRQPQASGLCVISTVTFIEDITQKKGS